MTPISRRSFLAATAGLAAVPAFGQSSGNVDIAIIGAGAAGIAAARRVAAAGKRVVLLEATDRAGGRCLTDTRRFGVPVDLGAHWIHMPEINPVAKLAPEGRARRLSRPARPAPAGGAPLCARRRAGGFPRRARALQPRHPGRRARKAGHVLRAGAAEGSGRSAATVEFFLGPFGCGKDLRDISAMDFAKSIERDVDAFCRQGFGTLLMKLAEGLPVELSAPVTPRRHVGTRRRRHRDHQGPHQRARGHRHGLDQCAVERQDQVRARPAQAPARRAATSSRSAATTASPGIARQSARPAARRPDVREGRERAHGGDARQCRRLDPRVCRCRREIRPRPRRARRARDDGFRAATG